MTDVCSGDPAGRKKKRSTCRCLMSLLMAAVITGEASLPSFMLAFSVDR
uniref:Uncharacterized protein n=1 Tax=Oryzias sinensis TaxID=183150 RepID=A0A8C7ZZM9_9TELE